MLFQADYILYLFNNFSLAIIYMLAALPNQLIRIIKRAQSIFRKRCEQFAIAITKSIKIEQLSTYLYQIDQALINFADNVSNDYFNTKISNFAKPIFLSNKQVEEQMTQKSRKRESLLNNKQENHLEFIKDSTWLKNMPIILDEINQQFLLREKQQNNEEIQQLNQVISLIISKLEVQQEKAIKYFIQNLIEDLEIPKLFIQSKNKQNIAIYPHNKKAKKKSQLFLQQHQNQSNNRQQQKLNDSKKHQFLEISQIKQKYGHIKRQLFKAQLEKLWFFQLTKQETYDKVFNCKNKEQLTILNAQISDCIKYLQKRTWKIEENCLKHNQVVYYVCASECFKEKVYLCNRCILNQEQAFEHQNHQIICKRHKKTVKYKIIRSNHNTTTNENDPILVKFTTNNQVNQQQKQFFLCQQCSYSDNQRPLFVSQCHYIQISDICIQQDCIQNDDFMICPTCNNHQTHQRKISFNEKSLLDIFYLNYEDDFSQYEKELAKAKEIIKFNPFQKFTIMYMKRLCKNITFLESFTVYDNEKVKEWINLLMKDGRKQNLMVLRGVLKMKEKKYSQFDKLNYLEGFNHLIEKEFKRFFGEISGAIQAFFQKIQRIMKHNSDQAEQLDKKYEEVIEIETDHQVFKSSIKSTQIHPIHHKQVKKIIIKKDYEHYQSQKVIKYWKDKRAKFFRQQVKNIMQNGQIVLKQQRNEIIQLFMKGYQNKKSKNQIIFNDLSKAKKYQRIIKHMEQKYSKINQNFRKELLMCLPWALLKQNQFNNLKVLQIQYGSRYEYGLLQKQYLAELLPQKYHYLKKYYHSIDAFEFFKFIQNNPQLEQVIIKGVQLLHMQQYFESIYRASKQSMKLLLSMTRLSIDYKFQLHPPINYQNHYHFEDSIFVSRVEQLLVFKNQFLKVDGITVVIRYKGNISVSVLGRLLMCLRGMKNIKIQIDGVNWLALKQMLAELAYFSEIASIAFNGIRFSSNASTNFADIQSTQNSLKVLFESNTITNLQIIGCSYFPSLPRITTLQSIKLYKVYFRNQFNLRQFIDANKQLRSIDIISIQLRWVIEEKLLNQLQYLRTDHIYLEHKGMLSPSSSRLKYLCIYNCVQESILRSIFMKLANLTQLKLYKFGFTFSLLSAIPSNQLEELQIFDNNRITDQDLQLIDCKWPCLRQIGLRYCPKITQKFLGLCKLKSLLTISISKNILSIQGKAYVRMRGVQVHQFGYHSLQ